MSGRAEDAIARGFRARHEGRPAEARRELAGAVATAREHGDRSVLIRALKGLAQIERDLGNGGAALPLYEEAVVLAREEGAALTLAHTVRHLGDLHQDAGRLGVAEPLYREALALYRGHGGAGTLDLANALRPLALLRSKGGAGEEAVRLWSEARELYAAAGVEEGVEECSAELAALARP